jgi:hypothetical protein
MAHNKSIIPYQLNNKKSPNVIGGILDFKGTLKGVSLQKPYGNFIKSVNK